MKESPLSVVPKSSSKQRVVVTACRSQLERGVMCLCQLTVWASEAGMGRLVSHWGSAGCWAGLGWAEMKGRWRIARKMKMGHSLCAPYDYYQWIAINGK